MILFDRKRIQRNSFWRQTGGNNYIQFINTIFYNLSFLNLSENDLPFMNDK
jgi:hypothetical protein